MSVLAIQEFLGLTKKIFKKFFYLYSVNLFFIIYIFLFSLIFFYFSSFLKLKILLFSLLFGCIASDIGGYFFGKLIQGPKLTRISPNKTIAGACGSIIFTCLAITGSIKYFTETLSLIMVVVSIITSVGQLGDLLFSFLKRKAKIKNTGNFLPGHGGVLDRLDGILLGVPLGFISLIFLLK